MFGKNDTITAVKNILRKRFEDKFFYEIRKSSNKTNDLTLNLTLENVTQHSRIVTTTRKGSSIPTKMSKIIGRQIH